MEEKIEIGQFQRMLQLATDKYNLNPEETFIEITWWDHVFLPLTQTDVSYGDESLILIFGETPCQSYVSFRDDMPFPTAFWIWNEATEADMVVHRPMKLKWFNGNYDERAKYVKFLFCSSPINYFVGINPFRTRIYKNRNDETILSLYVDDRDSGEYSFIEKLKADNIVMFADYDAVAVDEADSSS